MIVTIDGPAGAGKSSIAKRVAERLGFEFLDTGAMYRAVTLGAIRLQIAWDDVESLVAYAKRAELVWDGQTILLDGDDVTREIRTPVVTAAIRYMADLEDVRHELNRRQREIAQGRDIVSDGRDQGSEVFPDAQCKIFLTASARERAIRRQNQLKEVGKFLPLEEVLAAQDKRDLEDQSRPIGALRPAADAVVIESDEMTPDEVLARAIEIVESSLHST